MAEAAEAGEDYVLLARLGAGLYTLQQCALIMGHLWFVGDLGVRKRVLLLLHQQARPPRESARWRASRVWGTPPLWDVSREVELRVAGGRA